MVNEAILDALIGINQIQTWLEWRSVTLVSSQLGNKSRLYKIVVLKHRLLDIDILIYSNVEYTIEYMSLSEVSSALRILLSSKVKTSGWDSGVRFALHS